MKLFNGLILFMFILTSCAPSDSSVQTAIAQTQAALPTTIFTAAPPEVTSSSTPESDPILTETIAPPAALSTEVTDGEGIAMRLVPADEFTMGYTADEAYDFCKTISSHIVWYGYPCSKEDYLREEPIHKVYLNNFFMDVFEVSNEEYKKCVSQGICMQPSSSSANYSSNYYDNQNFLDHPVLNVTWEMAKKYCEWRGARLPTEAEWEKAARGIDERSHPWGNFNSAYELYNPSFYADRANVNLSTGSKETTVPVTSNSKGLSPYGFYNMAGNVAEWTADWYSETYYGVSPSENPLGPSTGDYKVVRGGSVNTYEVRTTARDYMRPTEYDSGTGIRCAKDPP